MTNMAAGRTGMHHLTYLPSEHGASQNAIPAAADLDQARSLQFLVITASCRILQCRELSIFHAGDA
jgi:hypothetical protein